MLAMPFDEIPYAEMVRFFADRMPGEVLLLGMDGVWEARFRQDFADVVFHSASWQEELPEAWRSRFSLIVMPPGIEELSAPAGFLEGLQEFLVPCGSLLLPFRNATNWSVFRSWLAGEMRCGRNPLLQGSGRLFSFPEIQNLAKSAHYEEIEGIVIMEEGDAETIRQLEALGAENERRQLETSWWVTRWTVIPKRVSYLKARYTDECAAGWHVFCTAWRTASRGQRPSGLCVVCLPRAASTAAISKNLSRIRRRMPPSCVKFYVGRGCLHERHEEDRLHFVRER